MASRPSLHRKLVRLVLAAVGASTAVAIAISIWQQASNYGAMRRQALLATAQVFAAAVAPATAARNGNDVFLSLRAIGRVPDIQFAEVRTADGRTLATSGSAARLLGDASFEDEQDVSLLALLTSGTVEVTVPIVDGGEEVGRFALIGGVSDLWPKLLYILVLTLVGGAAALLVGLLVAWRLAHSITAPLGSLLGAMAAIGQSHKYDVTVLDARDREIAELVGGFNRMLRDVRDRDERLEAHRRNLETEVADRTRELREARDVAETANRAKSDFLATMSHEIRTPMNGIMVMAELLTAGEMPRRQRRYAEIIAKSGRSLLAIINDILDFSKVEAGKLELECLPVDLNELAENIMSLFSERARRANIDLAAFVDPALQRTILGDPVRLGQVVTNLVNNSLKFTEHGFVELSMGYAAGSRKRIEICVSDSGIGIAEDKLATIFDAFSQADQSTTRQFGGTGLGLAICKRLVEAMDGEILVSSRPGEGSTFSVVIPCAANDAASWPKLPSSPGIALCIIDLQGRATGDVLAGYVSAAGYSVLDRDEMPTPDRCREARLIFADADRIAGWQCANDRSGPLVIAVGEMGSGSLEQLAASNAAAAMIAKPILRSEVEELLINIVNGETNLRPADAGSHRTQPVARFQAFKALVADDNAVNREVAIEALSRLGAVVDVVENGAEAVRAVAESAFDIVFMDGSMPEMDGFEATRRIRDAQARSTKATTIIVGLTAHVVGVGADEWRHAGMDAIVHKPFTIAELAQTIAKLLPHLVSDEAVELAEPCPAIAPENTHQLPETVNAQRPLLDEDVFDQLKTIPSVGGFGFIRKVFNLYMEHAPAAVAQIIAAAEVGDHKECGRAAHALKSMSYNVGAARVAGLALGIEQRCKDGGQFPAGSLASELSEAFQATITEIKSSLQTDDKTSLSERTRPRSAARPW